MNLTTFDLKIILMVFVIIFLDVIAIFLVMTDDFLYWYEKLFRILIILLLPFLGAYFEFKRNDDGTGSDSSNMGGSVETPPSFGAGD